MLLSGCGRLNYPALPDDAIAFEMGTFEDIVQEWLDSLNELDVIVKKMF